MRKTKIVATLGPALDDRDKLRAALEAGIDVVRLNFSHGAHDDHARRLRDVRELATGLERNIAVLADLQGPKIRLGLLPDDGIELAEGSEVTLVPGVEELDDYHSEGQVALPVVYEALGEDCEPGAMILIDDGSIRLVVSRAARDEVVARVVAGNVAKSRKGVNLPGVRVSAPSFTDKDAEDLKVAIDLGCDWLALSFVRTPDDLIDARARVHEQGGEAPLIAKLERPEAIDNLEAVVDASDAVMVARGDLGVEIGPERVPAIQKQIIAQANMVAKPVVTATEMLDSMINSPRPTRAEASDIANAIFDGTDAVMLSGETAAGTYPVEAVRTMARICEVAETSPHLVGDIARAPADVDDVANVVARSAVTVARDVEASALAIYSISGTSIQIVSKFRPPVRLVGLTPNETARRRTALMWGAEALLVPMKTESLDLITAAERVLVDGGIARHGDRVVIVSGTAGSSGGTNRIYVHRVGDELQR
ncbi:MAG: pyruvate kinase [Actinobacteria bacterium]|nr:pyruvate kinase [Actinomycetota bacterium]